MLGSGESAACHERELALGKGERVVRNITSLEERHEPCIQGLLEGPGGSQRPSGPGQKAARYKTGLRGARRVGMGRRHLRFTTWFE